MSVATAPESAQHLAQQVLEISSLPDTAVRIVETVQNADSGAHDLMRVLQSDPSLTARVLRTVNSAATGLSEKVRDLQKAISYLGFNQIRNLALTASISSIFREADQLGCYSRQGLWRHMVAVAIGARMIARRLELRSPEEVFLCGLLHDIGIILIDQYANPQFRDVLIALQASPEGTPLVTVERALLGFDHAELGALVVQAWRFPDLVTSSVRHHHARDVRSTRDPVVVQAVQAANIICTLSGLCSVGRRATECSAEVFRELGFSKVDVKVLATDLQQNIEQQKALFDLL